MEPFEHKSWFKSNSAGIERDLRGKLFRILADQTGRTVSHDGERESILYKSTLDSIDLYYEKYLKVNVGSKNPFQDSTLERQVDSKLQ